MVLFTTVSHILVMRLWRSPAPWCTTILTEFTTSSRSDAYPMLLMEPFRSNHYNNNTNVKATNKAPTSSTTTTSFEIVVTILHDRRQSKKRLLTETGDWLLSPEIQTVPVTICTPDRLVHPEQVVQFGRRTIHFDPTRAFDALVNASNRQTKSGGRQVTFLPIVNGYMASEVPGYLSYILQNWNALPDVVIFLHSIPQIHNPNLLSHLRHVMDHWTPAQIGFLHINDHIMVCREGRGPGGSWWKYWEILGFDPHHPPRRVKLPCCAQFMVTRDRILLRPRWFYQQALKLAYETQDAVFFEHYFHIMWGERPILSSDRELRTYAHSNWTKPVQEAVLYNPYPSIPTAESMKAWYDQAQADPYAYYPKRSDFRQATACPPGNDYWYTDNKKE